MRSRSALPEANISRGVVSWPFGRKQEPKKNGNTKHQATEKNAKSEKHRKSAENKKQEDIQNLKYAINATPKSNANLSRHHAHFSHPCTSRADRSCAVAPPVLLVLERPIRKKVRRLLEKHPGWSRFSSDKREEFWQVPRSERFGAWDCRFSASPKTLPLPPSLSLSLSLPLYLSLSLSLSIPCCWCLRISVVWSLGRDGPRHGYVVVRSNAA